MTKKEKRLKYCLENKNFALNKLKNIIISICHGQSITARTSSCCICGLGVTKKELSKMTRYSYGYQFGDFYNKRHSEKRIDDRKWPGHPRYFLTNVCKVCISEIEKGLNFTFVKSYAP